MECRRRSEGAKAKEKERDGGGGAQDTVSACVMRRRKVWKGSREAVSIWGGMQWQGRAAPGGQVSGLAFTSFLLSCQSRLDWGMRHAKPSS